MDGNILGGNFLGDNFPGGSSMGGKFPGGSLPGGNFPRTHVWVLLAAKAATRRGSLHTKYGAAWRQPYRRREPWRMQWRVRREK